MPKLKQCDFLYFNVNYTSVIVIYFKKALLTVYLLYL